MMIDRKLTEKVKHLITRAVSYFRIARVTKEGLVGQVCFSLNSLNYSDIVSFAASQSYNATKH